MHYLRAWGDFEHHTLINSAGEESRLDHIAWRTKRPEDVDTFATLLEQSGTEVNWVEDRNRSRSRECIPFQNAKWAYIRNLL